MKNQKHDEKQHQGELERFTEKIKFEDSGCWTWTHSTNGAGYGLFWFRGKTRLAHHVGWYFQHGSFPLAGKDSGFFVFHRCKNPGCVNPTHLEIRRRKESLELWPQKYYWGDRHASADLSEEEVLKIRELYDESPLSVEDLAILYGVCPQHVCRIGRRNRWKRLKEQKVLPVAVPDPPDKKILFALGYSRGEFNSKEIPINLKVSPPDEAPPSRAETDLYFLCRDNGDNNTIEIKSLSWIKSELIKQNPKGQS